MTAIDADQQLRPRDLEDRGAADRADDDGMVGSGFGLGTRSALEVAEARFAFLAESSRCLADSLDYETTLATVARLALPRGQRRARQHPSE